jgi:hypothetical protein
MATKGQLEFKLVVVFTIFATDSPFTRLVRLTD